MQDSLRKPFTDPLNFRLIKQFQKFVIVRERGYVARAHRLHDLGVIHHGLKVRIVLER